jgi:putative toxin-antitoxin system antitoxin component (TIGR02293 family)
MSMIDLRQAAKLLGLSLPAAAQGSDVALLELIERGLPLKVIERLSSALAPADQSFKYRLVPKATLGRYVSVQRRLNAAQRVLVTRLATASIQALRIWKTEEASREFLFRPHPLLNGCRPVDLVLKNDLGAELIRVELGRLETGAAV